MHMILSHNLNQPRMYVSGLWIIFTMNKRIWQNRYSTYSPSLYYIQCICLIKKDNTGSLFRKRTLQPNDNRKRIPTHTKHKAWILMPSYNNCFSHYTHVHIVWNISDSYVYILHIPIKRTTLYTIILPLNYDSARGNPAIHGSLRSY